MNWRGAIKLGALALLLFAPAAGADPGNDNRAPDLSEYPKLQVDAGHKVCFRAFAIGEQVYRWDGTSWVFVGPEAVLFDQDGEEVGTHYAGPTWESNSGSTVVARVLERATVDPDSIPWLKLENVSSEGPGPFADVTFVQRVNTVGGKAPADAGDFVGEVARVPYLADYYFYRKQ